MSQIVYGPPGDQWATFIPMVSRTYPVTDPACARCRAASCARGWYSLQTGDVHCAGCQIEYWQEKADQFERIAVRLSGGDITASIPPTADDIARLNAALASWN